MMNFIEKENTYYRSLEAEAFSDFSLKPAAFNRGLDWLIEGSNRIVDFGCGDGILSILCALRGVSEVTGIDLAEEGIKKARIRAQNLPQCRFLHGSVPQLQALPAGQFDGVILSNILDNLMPEDALTALHTSVHILKPGGKLLLKLNAYLSVEQIRDWNVTMIQEDFLNDGMLLWNKEDSFWDELLRKNFKEVRQFDIVYEAYNQHNRMFLCVK